MFWDTNTRQYAVSLLGEMYTDDATWGQLASVKQLILHTLRKLSESSDGELARHAKRLLLDLEMDGDSKKRALYQSCMQEDQKRLKEQGQDVYILPRTKISANATTTFDLTSNVQEFVDSDKKVFLVLGDSGSGKSTFNRALEINLWNEYDKIGGKIPAFIHLPAIKDPKRDLVAERLRQSNFTESQIIELKLYREFTLICDGYDESQQTSSLYMTNQLNQPRQWRAQMVIGCRTEYTGPDYKKYFQPTDWNSSRGSELYQEAIIAPFNKDQIQDCVEQYVNSEHPPWKTEDYQRAFEQVPNLQDLVKNPFLLKLALDVLPRLLGMNNDFSAAKRNHIRLMDVELSPRDKESFKIFSDEGFYQHGISYLKELATAIYDKQGGNPVISYSECLDRKTWKNEFLDNHDGRNLLREAIPLVHINDQYRFIHKSILEYGLSLSAYDPSARVETAQQEPGMSRRESTCSIFSFEDTTSIDETVTTVGQYLLDSPFGKKSFIQEPSVIQFLEERVQQHPTFKEQLLATIELSKTEKAARMQQLMQSLSGEQFIGADLRGIKIPGADLRYGMFDSVRLDGADLRKTKLHNIWLRKANLDRADMTGAQFGELPFLQENDVVRDCAYWNDGKTLAVGLWNGSFKLYDTSSWEKIKEFGPYKDQLGWFLNVLYSGTSDRIAYNGNDLILRLVDVNTGNCFQTLRGHTDAVGSVVYSPCGSKVASGSWDMTVRVWNVDTGECIHVLQGHSESVYNVAYSQRGDQIASASRDRTIRLWNPETGECIHILQGHSAGVSSVAYSPNGSQIASASEGDGTACLWDVETGNCLHNLEVDGDEILHLAYSPSGGQVALASFNKMVRLWDVEAGNCIHTLQGHSSSVYCAAYSPDGGQIASGSFDRTVRLWTVESNYFVRTERGHSDNVFSVAYSPDGDQIASASSDKTIRLWNAETGNCVNTLQDHSGTLYGVAYSSKGDQIASGSDDRTVKLWSVETGRCDNTLLGHSEQVGAIEYSPNGIQIASGSDDHTVRLWDVETGDCIRTLNGHTADVNWIAYSPKGDNIASASHDKTVRLWDNESGSCICTLQGHDGIVFSGHIDSIGEVAYSPSSDLIASGGHDKIVRLWDVETGQCLTIISGFSGYVHGLAWKVDENGQYLATGSCDKSVRCWEIIKEQDEYRVRLRWSSSHEALAVSDASLMASRV
ncbi:hypothetical protein BGZ80_004887 [Entomortierella chlamydospora]|uniref:Intraflagellar transport protein 122 homolog n=1 Tax=Entomortierella chlamydospora TaxID=101097 RepID=A0A9P6MLL3_9FUNG|nr:hypothetical protein BGZ80_004887 [Entomortierella chlamydospora]